MNRPSDGLHTELPDDTPETNYGLPEPSQADLYDMVVSDYLMWSDSCYEVFRARQKKYGTANIAAHGEKGCMVRASDKLARLNNYYFKGGPGDMDDESVEDALIDLANYAIIALMCRNGNWPGVAPCPPSS